MYFDFSMTDAEGQNTNFSMSSDAENSNAKRQFKYIEEEDGEETGLDIILTHKGIFTFKSFKTNVVRGVTLTF